ncbi:MAG: hypothetical protein J0H88_16200 [Sphingomonadales bacterium]|nr:hypothetical protein [Sphingomonadales bacterium]
MPPVDPFASQRADRDDPARDGNIIVPSGNDLPKATKAIRAGADGTITLTPFDGAEFVHPVYAGERIDMVIKRVSAANPSNMVIIGYY